MRAQLVVSLGNTLGDGVERRVCGGRRERERDGGGCDKNAYKLRQYVKNIFFFLGQ